MDLANTHQAYKDDQSWHHREFWRAIFEAVRKEGGETVPAPELEKKIVPEEIDDIFEEGKQ